MSNDDDKRPWWQDGDTFIEVIISLALIGFAFYEVLK